MNALCCWHRTKQLTFDSSKKDTEMFTGVSSLKQLEDVRSGLSLCRRGTAERRWGRSPSRRPPATACRRKETTLISLPAGTETGKRNVNEK